MVASRLPWGGRVEGTTGYVPSEASITAFVESEGLSMVQLQAIICSESFGKSAKFRQTLQLVKELEPGAFQDHNKKNLIKVTPLKMALVPWHLMVHRKMLESEVCALCSRTFNLCLDDMISSTSSWQQRRLTKDPQFKHCMPAQEHPFDARTWAKEYFQLSQPKQQETLTSYLKMKGINQIVGGEATIEKLTEHAVSCAAEWIQQILDRGLAAISLTDAKVRTTAMAAAVVAAFASGRQQFQRQWEGEEADSSLRQLLQVGPH